MLPILAVFKVNDRQYIEVTPTLASESDDKLIQIGFETKDARKLRDYLAAKGVTVPAKAGKDDRRQLQLRGEGSRGTPGRVCGVCQGLAAQQTLRRRRFRPGASPTTCCMSAST